MKIIAAPTFFWLALLRAVVEAQYKHELTAVHIAPAMTSLVIQSPTWTMLFNSSTSSSGDASVTSAKIPIVTHSFGVASVPGTVAATRLWESTATTLVESSKPVNGPQFSPLIDVANPETSAESSVTESSTSAAGESKGTTFSTILEPVASISIVPSESCHMQHLKPSEPLVSSSHRRLSLDKTYFAEISATALTSSVGRDMNATTASTESFASTSAQYISMLISTPGLTTLPEPPSSSGTPLFNMTVSSAVLNSSSKKSKTKYLEFVSKSARSVEDINYTTESQTESLFSRQYITDQLSVEATESHSTVISKTTPTFRLTTFVGPSSSNPSAPTSTSQSTIPEEQKPPAVGDPRPTITISYTGPVLPFPTVIEVVITRTRAVVSGSIVPSRKIVEPAYTVGFFSSDTAKIKLSWLIVVTVVLLLKKVFL